MGMGATNTYGRLAASVGCLDEVKPTFENCADVPNGGCSLGVARPTITGSFKPYKKSFYAFLLSLPFFNFYLLAFMALARLKFIESLKYTSPGEWGKLLGSPSRARGTHSS